MTDATRSYFIKAGSPAPYSPKNHTGTVNRRIIGRENVGATQLEVVLGRVEKAHGALPHSHPGIEQVCYMLSGAAVAEVAGQTMQLGPGDACFFPADAPHTFVATSEQPVEVLIIYSPPYAETHARTHEKA
ncbi:cupin domain-containing protein [Phreatobacter stygius]|uniref:Cupin domain-containing protein n=1 Tax=Phreatobacter stygius TaxID=1940610 RepID=A0A4D7BC79_9HYPH|nr:cupin domain-containing protein [Phreatobacter stygius]QCI68315.1 cupin domain-containing protein [Phreatobacter stygius]